MHAIVGKPTMPWVRVFALDVMWRSRCEHLCDLFCQSLIEFNFFLYQMVKKYEYHLLLDVYLRWISVMARGSKIHPFNFTKTKILYTALGSNEVLSLWKNLAFQLALGSHFCQGQQNQGNWGGYGFSTFSTSFMLTKVFFKIKQHYQQHYRL